MLYLFFYTQSSFQSLKRLFSPFINRAVFSNKWEAPKCQDQQLTNTAETCDIYLMLGQFEKAHSILKVKWASYLKDNHFSLPYKSAVRLLNLHVPHRYCTGNSTLTAAPCQISSAITAPLYGLHILTIHAMEPGIQFSDALTSLWNLRCCCLEKGRRAWGWKLWRDAEKKLGRYDRH